MRSDLLTVQKAAEIVGVSTSTLKRMCDSESIQLIRTPGGHRRIDKMDLDRVASRYLRAKSNVENKLQLEADLSVDVILSGLLNGESLEVAKLFARSADSPMELMQKIEDYLVAALWQIGESWRNGTLAIYEEHICSNTALTVLDILRQKFSKQSANSTVAVGGALSPALETIPSKLVAFAFELNGSKAIDLGCSIPPTAMALAAIDKQASIVWVTHTHVGDVDLLIRSHQILRDQLPAGVRIILGGGGLSPATRRSLSWCEFYETISQLLQHELQLSSHAG